MQLIYDCRISSKQLKDALAWLTEHGMIECKDNRYSTTEGGRKYVEMTEELDRLTNVT